MSQSPLSVPDVAESLMHEFHSVLPESAVTEVVIRLSRTDGVAVAELAASARRELLALTADLAAKPDIGPELVAP